MSSFIIVGLFALSNARRIAAPDKTSDGNTQGNPHNHTFHYYYTSAIQCANDQALPAEIRIYSPANDPGHPELTVAFVAAKAHIPPNGATLLDAYYMIPFPGNPQHPAYQDSLPDLLFPFVFAVGHVAGSDIEDNMRVTSISVSDYVCDGTKATTILGVYDTKSPRWANTRPAQNTTCISVFGVCAGVDHNGLLHINIDNITLSLSAQSPSTGSQKHVQLSPSSSPSKRCKIDIVRDFTTTSSSSLIQMPGELHEHKHSLPTRHPQTYMSMPGASSSATAGKPSVSDTTVRSTSPPQIGVAINSNTPFAVNSIQRQSSASAPSPQLMKPLSQLTADLLSTQSMPSPTVPPSIESPLSELSEEEPRPRLRPRKKAHGKK
ncbi:hypothetical protein DXG01_014719 [Tephrocybe rancida]|nr:hypothetical protein DXG01_014719 [Tephrocybe rancida]